MKFKMLLFFIVSVIPVSVFSQAIIADHNCTNIKSIPENAILDAKSKLHIAYGHTSHGSQLITGMNNLDEFMGGNGLYVWNDGPKEGFLDIDDNFVGGDLGHNGDTAWASRTRDYLNNSAHSDVNVVIWSWCGGVSDNTEEGIQIYLDKMNELEQDFPNVKFVYMTGHLDGSGEDGNLHLRNEQIRAYCRNNNKILFDFADIESYDPDGNYFLDKMANDNCDYDTDGNGSRDGNWAEEWQNSHTEGVDWYDCYAAHSKPLNGNLKAYAAWWLWAKLVGWEGVTSIGNKKNKLTTYFELYQNYPNPFNPETVISYELKIPQNISLKIFDVNGNEIATLFNGNQQPGNYSVKFSGEKLTSGIYFCRLSSGSYGKTIKITLTK